MKEIISQMGLRPAAKAWAGALVTGSTVALALFGFGDMPPEAEISAALFTAASVVIGYLGPWLARNR